MGLKIRSKYGGKKIRRLVATTGAETVRVGVLEGAGPHPNGNGATYSEIAWWNEFGTQNIPERPFMRNTLREHHFYSKELVEAMVKTLRDAVSFRPVSNKRLHFVGMRAVRDIQQTIRSNSFTPNAPSVQRRKGQNKPLFNQGLLLKAVSYEVIRAK